MKFSQFCLLGICTIGLIGCTATTEHGVGVVKSNSPTTQFSHKRINTTECKDADDWYLDGYRVGKSFSAQKTEMLQQRANYCRYTVNKLPSQFKRNWEKGFTIGNNEIAKSRPKSKKRS